MLRVKLDRSPLITSSAMDEKDVLEKLFVRHLKSRKLLNK